jgi:hypothetical protein
MAVAAAASAMIVLGHPATDTPSVSGTTASLAFAEPITPSGWRPKHPIDDGPNPFEIDHSNDNTITDPVIGAPRPDAERDGLNTGACRHCNNG